MKKMLLFISVIFFINLNLYSQQTCTPSDACANAPRLCMNGFITNTAGFTAGTEPVNCPNGQQWTADNDLWIAFIPTQSNLEITVDINGNCSSGSSIQALIHDNCNTDPIDCDVDCFGSPSVGAGISFNPGQTYFLRVDGCNGAFCPIQITTNPANAIVQSNNTLTPLFTSISGLSTIPCPSEKEYVFTALSNICAPIYNWKIESGNATFNTYNSEITDNNNNNPEKDISIIGVSRTSVKVKFKGEGNVVISVSGTDGCQSTNTFAKTINVKSINNIDTIYAYTCPYQVKYENDSFPGSPFVVNDTCGKFNSYDFIFNKTNECNRKVRLFVGKTCDTTFYKKDLGNINICKNGSFIIFNKSLKDGKFENIHDQVYFTNINEYNCPNLYSGNIVPLDLNVQINGDKIVYKCPKDTISLNASVSNYFSNTELVYHWQKYNEVNKFWYDIQFPLKNKTVDIYNSGFYRLFIEANIKNTFQNDSFTANYCTMNFYSDSIQIIEFPKPSNSIYSIKTMGGCIGDTVKLAVTNKNSNHSYTWTDDIGNIYYSDSVRILLKNKDQLVTLSTFNACNEYFNQEIKLLKGDSPISKDINIIGNTENCTNKLIVLKLINFDKNYSLDWPNIQDSFYINKINDSLLISFNYSGIYSIPLLIANNCSSLSIIKNFNITESVPKINIRGSKSAIEKTTQTYCVNNPNNNIITWTTSKNLKYKVSSTNKQSCIYVTFPKGINVGWIKSTISNNCSTESDSILIVSKPKLGNIANEHLDEDSNNINNRATQSEEIEFSVFPNPATNIIEVKGNLPFDQIEILDVLGKSKLIDNISNKFDISELNAGFYILKIISNNKVLSKSTFIKID